jgi:ADP-heptose:LPS heptosyltransferase
MSKISSSNPPERFLLIRTDRIGDTILTLPAVTALRKRYPTAFIIFLAQPYTAPLIEKYEGIDLRLTYEPERQHKGWPGILRLSRELEELKIDAALLFYPRVELAFALFKAKIPLRIGTAYRWYSFLLNQRIFEHRKECRKHETEYNLSLLASLLPGETKIPHTEFKKWSPEPWWNNFQSELNLSKYVIVHPGSGSSAPNLNKTQYRLIIRLLLEKTNWTVLLSGTSGEKDLVHELAVGFPKGRVKEIAGRFSLAEFFSVIRNSSLLITSSTGPLHLANATGTPLLGFFCPVKPHTPHRWGPYDQQKWVVTPKLDSPETCNLKNCPYGGCLQQISDSDITSELCEKRLKDLI